MIAPVNRISGAPEDHIDNVSALPVWDHTVHLFVDSGRRHLAATMNGEVIGDTGAMARLKMANEKPEDHPDATDIAEVSAYTEERYGKPVRGRNVDPEMKHHRNKC